MLLSLRHEPSVLKRNGPLYRDYQGVPQIPEVWKLTGFR